MNTTTTNDTNTTALNVWVEATNKRTVLKHFTNMKDLKSYMRVKGRQGFKIVRFFRGGEWCMWGRNAVVISIMTEWDQPGRTPGYQKVLIATDSRVQMGYRNNSYWN